MLLWLFTMEWKNFIINGSVVDGVLRSGYSGNPITHRGCQLGGGLRLWRLVLWRVWILSPVIFSSVVNLIIVDEAMSCKVFA